MIFTFQDSRKNFGGVTTSVNNLGKMRRPPQTFLPLLFAEEDQLQPDPVPGEEKLVLTLEWRDLVNHKLQPSTLVFEIWTRIRSFSSKIYTFTKLSERQQKGLIVARRAARGCSEGFCKAAAEQGSESSEQ